MAVSIYTNIYSTIAQNNLATANSSLTKSIERLSSGLRINHAADDASGLAISEKLRGQIRGLAKASMNAQDAISFLQTAEGGMEVIGDMLQRMRELSVQAGNGTYTANDRAELQKEVGQLKDEVNRIASSTEYNTKKLLTGDAAGLFSTNAPSNIDAIMRGTPAEGNYKIDIALEGGAAYEYKSNIFTRGGDLVKYTIGSISDSAVTVNKFKANSDYDVTIGVGASAAVTAKLDGVAASNKGSFTLAASGSTYTRTDSGSYVVEALTDGVAGKDSFKVSFYGADGKATKIDVTSFSDKKLTLSDGSVIVMTGDTFNKGDKGLYTGQTAIVATDKSSTKLGDGVVFKGKQASYVTLDTNGSVRVNTVEVDASSATNKTGVVLKVKGNADGSYSLNTAGNTKATWATSNSGSLDLVVTKIDTAVTTAVNKDLGGDIAFSATTGDHTIGRQGSYVVEALKTGSFATADGDKDIFKVTFYGADGLPQEMKGSFDGTAKKLTLDDGSVLALTGTDFTKGQTGGVQSEQPTVKDSYYSQLGSGPKFLGTKASAVILFKGSSDVKVVRADSNATAAGKITFKNDIGVVDENTMLKDIMEFTNKDGRMILDNTQTISIVANGKTVDVSVEATDTVRALVDKMNAAFDKIGMGDDVVGFNKLDEFPGVLSFKAGNDLLGDFSKIDFNGDESLLNALGVTTMKPGENPLMTVTVTDAHTNSLIGKDTIGDNMLRNVIQGVDVKIKGARDGDSYFLHVKDNRTEVQIGANEGQKFDVSIARMDTAALEIDDANVLTMEASQKAITKFDQALTKVNSARATIGAQINRLEYTMKNLSISRQNLVAAESRIRDLDVAEESANFSRNQILTNAATAMLAQANQIPQSALQLIGR